MLHNFMWGGAPNLLQSCQTTGFHSVNPPWLVWWMGSTWRCPWIQWVHGVHIWFSQSKLLLWIKIWIHHPPIIGKSWSTYIWWDHTCHFLVAPKWPCCKAWYVLIWKCLGWPVKGTGYHPLLLWFLVVDLELRLKNRDFKIELKILVSLFLCKQIVCLPYTGNVSLEMIIVATWFRSYGDLATV